MFATIKSLIPEPRQADQPRRYVGRHRKPEPVVLPVAPVSPAPMTAEPVADETDTTTENIKEKAAV